MKEKYDLVINVQGDEPIINPKIIDDIINKFQLENDEIVSVAKPINDIDLINDINIVKVEFNSNMLAKEFYREAKEYRYSISIQTLWHLCIQTYYS